MDGYDFHALEGIQCMLERRQGGETGVRWVHAVRGEEFWEALDSGSWEAGGWVSSMRGFGRGRSLEAEGFGPQDMELFEAGLCRSQQLRSVEQYETADGGRYERLTEI